MCYKWSCKSVRNIYYIIPLICFTLYIDIIMHLLKNKNNDKIYNLIFTVFFMSNLLENENKLYPCSRCFYPTVKLVRNYEN